MTHIIWSLKEVKIFYKVYRKLLNLNFENYSHEQKIV